MSSGARIAQAQRLLAEQAIDLLAVSPGDDLVYLLGYSPTADERPWYLLLHRNSAAFVLPHLNAAQASQHVTLPTFVYTDAEGPV